MESFVKDKPPEAYICKEFCIAETERFLIFTLNSLATILTWRKWKFRTENVAASKEVSKKQVKEAIYIKAYNPTLKMDGAGTNFQFKGRVHFR